MRSGVLSLFYDAFEQPWGFDPTDASCVRVLFHDAADALAVAITHAHVRASANRLGTDARTAWGRKGRGRR